MKSGIQAHIVFVSDYKQEILDPVASAEYGALPTKKDGTIKYANSRKMLPYMMYFDLLELVHRDEWAKEGMNLDYPAHWGFPRG